MELILLFSIKLFDNILSTCKSIYLSKEKYIKASVFNAFSTFFYFIAIVQMTKSNSLSSVIVICLATFIGTYASGKLIRKQEGDRLYIFRITSDTFENGTTFADAVRKNNIPIQSTIVYDQTLNKTLFCEVYCKTKDESKTINDLLPKSFKYHIQNPI